MEQAQKAEMDADFWAAAIADGPGGSGEEALAQAVRWAKTQGLAVRGLLMVYPDGSTPQLGCPGSMVLVDVHGGGTYTVSQPLGTLATACRIDTAAMAQAGEVLRRARHEAPDVVVCNRFGGLEARGDGFRAEMLDLLAAGIPLLTTVLPQHRDDWLHFSGGAPVLAPGEVRDWLQALAERTGRTRPSLGAGAASAV